MSEGGKPSLIDETQTALRNNATAYGYSVTITASFGLLTRVLGSASVGEIFLFAAGALVSFALLEAAITRGFRERPSGESPDVIALGSSISFLSVGGGLGVCLAEVEVFGGTASWFLGSFAGTLAFLMLVGVEIFLARRIKRS